jgi:septum formation protein
MPRLILASTSTYRSALLERLRVPFTQESPGIDEAASKRAGETPVAIAQALARLKARAVLSRHPDAIVVGSDQVATIDERVLDKPGTEANAREQLQLLRGREHRLLTAVAIAHGIELTEFVDTTRLVMRPLADDEIERYLAAERPFDCAGSYKIEGLGIALFERIDSHDQTAIIGLPLLRLAAELRRVGLHLP